MSGTDLARTRAHLRADCSRCEGLCCVAPAFAASSDFALDKPAGTPCPNLRGDARCGIHADLRGRGFAGCTVFDCFGAGQHVVGVTHAGRSWRAGPQAAQEVFTAFAAARQLHEALWYLEEAAALVAPGPTLDEVVALRERVQGLADRPAGSREGPVRADEVGAAHQDVGALLERTSTVARWSLRPDPPRHRYADLVGADLRRADLVAADLRGSLLLGADLRGADLRGADLLGADLRGADVRGARLAGALFLTVPQLTAARGDGATQLPDWAERPGHWPTRAGRR